MSFEIGDKPDPGVEEIRRGLEQLGQQQKALKDRQDGAQPSSLHEQRQQQIRDREEAFHKQAAEELEAQHDEMRAPIRGKPTSRVLPPRQADGE